MWDLINEFSISTKIIEDLFDGVETDLEEKVKLNSRKDLLIYSYRVAGTVGLMMAKILRVNSEKGLNSAIDLGIAMQPQILLEMLLKTKSVIENTLTMIL